MFKCLTMRLPTGRMRAQLTSFGTLGTLSLWPCHLLPLLWGMFCLPLEEVFSQIGRIPLKVSSKISLVINCGASYQACHTPESGPISCDGGSGPGRPLRNTQDLVSTWPGSPSLGKAGLLPLQVTCLPHLEAELPVGRTFWPFFPVLKAKAPCTS